MDAFIDIFPEGTDERKQLEKVASLLTQRSPRGYSYYVDEVYFDYGQDWMWTTILCDDGDWGYQALCPREQEEILLGGDPEEIIKGIFADKFCPDRL